MLKCFAAFFAFGATMCLLTVLLLLFSGTPMDALWGLNPDARTGFKSIGKAAFLLMVPVGVGCGFAAVGLWKRKQWGITLAIAILSLNLAGDVLNAFVRADCRTLIGLPIGGLMIFFLARYRDAAT